MSDEEGRKAPGKLNIVGLFEAEAASLLHAVERGRLLHKTRNIRDSGALLESRFCEIIGSRLPPQTQLAHGYLFDVDSTCTPQIDAMLLSAADNHPMMAGEGGAIYAPFTSCKAYVEIKSAVGDAAKQLGQTAKIAERIKEMRTSLLSRQPDSFRFERIASVLLFVQSEGAKAADFINWYKESRWPPTLVVFLDKALVIAQRPALYNFVKMYNEETLTFEESLSGTDAWLYRPAGDDPTEARGRVLLWLYYFLLYCATEREVKKASEDGNNDHGQARAEIPPVKAFIIAASRQFPLVPVQELQKVTDFGGS
ncbi:DUF6602 domain-containing protein [Polaromonas sp. JS666]|uniref:DUF6602 domain-containing protein n=1 Tax=Polaromonas sp. (strain JS666 / ATCC BAA-500) TaxID=296591 RepID=UPI00005349A5|nr:DUF6602 domain-containing protein [Polaromonas sp. JS666]ABE43862.1 hypothetical protein Bpro_1931 [Polaromonas sp. JS666]